MEGSGGTRGKTGSEEKTRLWLEIFIMRWSHLHRVLAALGGCSHPIPGLLCFALFFPLF